MNRRFLNHNFVRLVGLLILMIVIFAIAATISTAAEEWTIYESTTLETDYGG